MRHNYERFEMTKKVLIITYHFPPRPSVASIRLGGLAKFLPEFGWEPTILTAKLPSDPDPRYRVIEIRESDILLEWKKRLGFSSDKTFRDQLGQTGKKDTYIDHFLHVVREVIAYPDYNKNWKGYAIPVARDLLKQEKFDAIISSSGPSTAHLVANTLKKESGLPWIADFRDLWTLHHLYSYGRVRKYFETKLEVQILANADAITTVSHPLAEKLQHLHHKMVYVVPNGFDPELLNHTSSLFSKFSINYTGRMYRGKMDPEPLFRVIRKLINENSIDPSDVEIHFWGCAETWIQRLVDEYNLNNVISLHDAIPRAKALWIQRSSQILLLFIWNDPKEKGIITGKIYEYLAAQRPILAIGPFGGTIPKLLEETNTGITAENEQDIETAIMRHYHQFRTMQMVPYSGNKTNISRYSHREMARCFSVLLEKVTKSPEGNPVSH
jgi:hypothetical protein